MANLTDEELKKLNQMKYLFQMLADFLHGLIEQGSTPAVLLEAEFEIKRLYKLVAISKDDGALSKALKTQLEELLGDKNSVELNGHLIQRETVYKTTINEQRLRELLESNLEAYQSCFSQPKLEIGRIRSEFKLLNKEGLLPGVIQYVANGTKITIDKKLKDDE